MENRAGNYSNSKDITFPKSDYTKCDNLKDKHELIKYNDRISYCNNDCERCGQKIDYSKGHYHCNKCEGDDETD